MTKELLKVLKKKEGYIFAIALLIFFALISTQPDSRFTNKAEAVVGIDGTWEVSSSGISGVANIIGIAVDPANWNTIYVYTESSGIYKTADGGTNWVTKNSGLPANPSAHMGHVFTNVLSIDPSNGNNLYINVAGEVYRSTNGADSWTKMSAGTSISCGTGLGSKSNITGVLVDRRDGKHLWAGTVASGCTGGVFEIANIETSQQWQWVAGQDGTSSGMNNDGWELTQSKANPALLFSSSVHTVARKSTDNGHTWTSILPTGLGDVKVILRPHPSDSNFILSFANEKLFKSSNQGTSWAAVTVPGSPQITDIQFAPSDGNIVYMTAGAKLYKSTDKGSTWTVLTEQGGSKPFKAIVVNPSDPNKIYISTGGAGVIKSDNGGGNTTAITRNLPEQIAINHVNTRQEGTGTPQLNLYAFASGHGIYKSIDQGKTWTIFSSDFEIGGAVKSHFFEGGTAYAAVADLYRSDDGGVSWKLISPVEGQNFRNFAVRNADPNTIIAGSYESKKIYKSTNKGETWSVVSQATFAPEDIELDPTNPSIIFCASFNGLWKSTDGGVTWTNLYQNNKAIFTDGAAGERFEVVDINPGNRNQIFVANRSAKGFISDDGGLTWKVAVSSANGGLIGKATFSRHDTSIIYTSDGSSAYIVKRGDSEYTSTKIPSTGIGAGEFMKSKYFGVVEDATVSKRILTSTGKVYSYDTSGIITPSVSLELIVSLYGTSNSEADQNSDGFINGFDFVKRIHNTGQ